MIYNQDSLNEAENEFVLKKYSLPRPNPVDESPSKKGENYQKLTGYSSSTGGSSVDYFKKFNYIDFKSIQTKQRHGYDIINCIPTPRH